MRPIKGCEGYFVDINGAVFSNRRGELRKRKPHTIKGGYMRVNMHVEGKVKLKLIHVLVAETFLEKPDMKVEVNHKDGDKTNNHVENLEWKTRSQNLIHSYRVLGNPFPHSKPVRCISTGIVYPSSSAAAKEVGVDPSNVAKAVRGVQKTAGGYRWELAL